MWLRQILRYQIPTVFLVLDNISLSNDLDATSATHIGRLQDIHMLEVRHLSVVVPALEVFWQDISSGAYIKLFTLLPPLLLAVSP